MSLQPVQSAAAPPVARVMPLKYASLLLDPGSLAGTEQRPWLVCWFSPSPSRVASSHSSVSLLQRDRVMWEVCVICLRALCCTTASAAFLLLMCVLLTEDKCCICTKTLLTPLDTNVTMSYYRLFCSPIASWVQLLCNMILDTKKKT